MDIELQMQLVQAMVDKIWPLYRSTWPADKVEALRMWNECAGEFQRFNVPVQDFGERIDQHVQARAIFVWLSFEE